MTTQGRRDYDATKFRVTLRDLVVLSVGIATMWGIQVATQGRTQAAIENLATKVDGYQQKQMERDTSLQQQIDEARRTANGARVSADEAIGELRELRGFLAGSGVKNVPVGKTGGLNNGAR